MASLYHDKHVCYWARQNTHEDTTRNYPFNSNLVTWPSSIHWSPTHKDRSKTNNGHWYIHSPFDPCFYSNRWVSFSIYSQVGSRTLCFIATLLCYSFIPDNFTNYAQLCSPLCPMCTQRLRDSSDRVGALSRSSNEMWTPSPWAYYPSSDMSCCKSQTLRSSC